MGAWDCGEQMRLAQEMEDRIERLQIEIAAMEMKALQLRVQAATASNRLVRLDSPIVFGRLAALKEELLQQINEP